MEWSIFWSEEPPVRDSAPPESRVGSTMSEVSSVFPLLTSLEQCARDGLFGKMYRGSLAPTEEKISKRSSGRLMKSGILAHSEFWMLNTVEWTATLAPYLKEDGVCSLSDILQETGVIPLRYFLSQTACKGILRRSESRGRGLPPLLKEALERQALMDTAG